MSGLSPLLGVAELVSGRGSPWMWAFLAALALSALSFARFYQVEMETRRKVKSLPHQLDDLLREGHELNRELLQPPKEPYTILPRDERLDPVIDLHNRAYHLLLERDPAYADDASKYMDRHYSEELELVKARQDATSGEFEEHDLAYRTLHSLPVILLRAVLEALSDARKAIRD